MKLFNLISKLIPQDIAYAHCDIPCGVYDPYNLQRAAHTIVRMTELLGQIKLDDDLKSDHTIVRVTHVKEEHSNILEYELSTLRNDYFKEEHMTKYPELEDLFKKTLKSAAKARQDIDLAAAEDVLNNSLKIAEIFYETKGVEHFRTKSLYPTEREIVLHK